MKSDAGRLTEDAVSLPPWVAPRDRRREWHPLSGSVTPKAVTAAAARAGLAKPVTPPVVRHALATYLWEDGHDLRTVQELLGQAHVETTMICTHV